MDEILGGQYLGAAKPFNVLNPSGISGEQSLATITAVGEGNRNRAAQASAQARQIAASQEARRVEMEHQAEEAERDRKSQEKRWKDEQFYRDRSERLAMLYQDHQMEEDRLQEQLTGSLARAQDDQVKEILEARSAVARKKAEVGLRLQGLEVLNTFRNGLFSPDFRNEKGSIGAQLLESLQGLSAGRVASLNSASDFLGQAYENLFLSPSGAASPGGSPTTKSEGGESPWWQRVGKFVSDMMYGSQEGMEKMFPAGTEAGDAVRRRAAKTKEPSVSPLLSSPGSSYRGLAEALARGAAGQAGSATEVAAGLAAMLSSLQQAVANPGNRQGYLDHARSEYETLRDKGVDTYTLDRLLKNLWQRASGNQKALAGAKGSAILAGVKEGAVSTNEDVTAIDQRTKANPELVQMLQLLGAASDTKDPKKRLLKYWDEGSFLDLGTKMPTYEVEKMVVGAVTALSGARNPMEMIRLLQDNDPENDPSGFGFMKSLDPEARQVILSKIVPALQRLEEKQVQHGVSGEWDPEEIPRLRKQESDFKTELETDTLESRARRQDKTVPARQAYEARKKEAAERYQKRRDAVQKERP